MGLTTGLDLGLLLFLFTLFIYVFARNVITAQYKVYLLFHFFMMVWPFGQIGVHTIDNPHLQIVFITISFVGLSMLGFGWLLFTNFLVDTSYKPRRNVVLSMLTPSLLLSIGMIWNPANLFVAPVKGGYLEREYGPIFWAMVILLLSYYVYSLHHLWTAYLAKKPVYEKARIANALVGLIIMSTMPLLDLLLNVILDRWLPVIPGLTSLGIVLSDLYFVLSLQKHRSLDIVKVAQQDVFNTLSVGIIVLDEHEMVIELNSNVSPNLHIAVGDSFNMEKLLLGYSLEKGREEELLLKYRTEPSERITTELIIDQGDSVYQYLSMKAAPVMMSGNRIGKVITLQDISELKTHILKSQEHNTSLQERNRALIYMQDELFQANRKLEQMAITDSLTGCFNRRFLMQQLEHEVLTNLRYKIPFALFLFDIDLFKLVNDTYGHIIGDEVIRQTAEVVKAALRRTDILARYGGEEFSVYLPHTNREQAEVLAQRIREVVESNEIATGLGLPSVSVTISMGMHVIDEQSEMRMEDVKSYLRDLFAKVDTALYRAKDNGRNRVVNL
ncbi:GGDEF domain-containing protein [Paenibacillus sp. R14(2021)]|uniref:histidine kinase N-terminal 7TM domain-containing diguanylate cyclase n=1 Tax=Paenibacillus sp. R14(2021) TaxID=2859228 RepID=UPI001C613E2B|nr:GGDEF domain-containing protein [Paenibacillus sp. R14(2021)]